MKNAKKLNVFSNDRAYEKVIHAFRARQKGATPADIAAATGLPLNNVRELVTRALDEYGGRLEVTESGEILYSFPGGFISRYRGFGPGVRKFLDKLIHYTVETGTLFFKVWIMVMLLGYFLFFMLLAVASLFLSAAGSSSSSRSRRGGNLYFGMGFFNLIIRLWFYSELAKSLNPGQGYRKSRSPSRPLYKAIFSFVFGDGDPNVYWEDELKKFFLAYLREHQGVISLPELMILGGFKPDEAEKAITALCVEFNGSPEATENGTVVYRFDEILMASENAKKQSDLPLLYKTQQSFSSNPEKMNQWFAIINGVNLFFGIYFLYNSAVTGHIFINQARGIYGLVYAFLSAYANPLPIIAVALGIIPLVFSVLFWFIPLLRRIFLKNKNNKIRFENFKKFSFFKIWNSPMSVKKADLNPPYRDPPENLDEARNQVLKEMGNYAIPDISIDEQKNEVYSFTELEREKQALDQYRASIDPNASSLGKTIFDSGR